MKIIETIEIKNYKSIISERIDLEGKTALVGANESGKSNVLNALHHLERINQKKEFKPNEQNISVKYSDNSKIEITYHIKLTKTLIPSLLGFIPELENKLVLLTKSGYPNEAPTWSLKIVKFPKFGNLALIASGEKTRISFALKKSGFSETWKTENIAHNFFIAGGDIKLTAKPFHSFIQNKKVTVAKDEVKENKVGNFVRDEILRNLQIYFWKFEHENYLTESIPIEDYCKLWNKKKYETVTGIFKIAKNENAFAFDLSSINLRKNLIESGKSTRANLLEKHIAKKFNLIFNRSWKTYWGKPIKLKMNYEETDLTFRFDDGHDIPPEYRSDGFKWFLTFMINFQSKEKSLSNYILLIDEPGGNLHPKGQKDALAFINKLNKNNQIIYSTHQTFLIDKNQPESIRILERSTKFKKFDFYQTKVHNIRNERDHILRDQLLRDSLGFTLSDISPLNENNILVEGTFDRNVLHICNQKFKILDLNSVSIIDCGKATNIKYSAQQYQSSGLKIVCLYDSDKDGKRAMDDNSHVNNKFKILISKKANRTIEDLLPLKIFESAYNHICTKHKDFLKKKTEIKKPYMNVLHSSLKSGISKETRGTIKHDLEDKMTELIIKDFDQTEYLEIESILKEIKELLK